MVNKVLENLLVIQFYESKILRQEWKVSKMSIPCYHETLLKEEIDN